MKKQKQNRAITLIALVISIIVIIILAGVTINTLINNGIIDKAKTATQEYKNAQDYEETQIAKYANYIDNNVDGSRDTVTISKEEYNELKEKGTMVKLAEQVGSGNYTSFTVPDLTKYSYFVFQVYDGSGIFETIHFSYDDIKKCTSDNFRIKIYFGTDIVAKLYYESDISVKITNTQSGAKLYGIK